MLPYPEHLFLMILADSFICILKIMSRLKKNNFKNWSFHQIGAYQIQNFNFQIYWLSEVHYSIFNEEMRKLSVYDYYQTILRVCSFFPMIILAVLNNSGLYPYIWWPGRCGLIFTNLKQVTISFYLRLFWNTVSDTKKEEISQHFDSFS